MKENALIEIHPIAMITDPQGNLLLSRRNETAYWEFPGGILTPRESIKDCLQHSILRNDSILLEKITLLQVFSGPELSYLNDDAVRINPVYMLFQPNQVRGSLCEKPKDGSELRFFAPWNIPMNQVFPPMKCAVRFFTDVYTDERQSADWDRLPSLLS